MPSPEPRHDKNGHGWVSRLPVLALLLPCYLLSPGPAASQGFKVEAAITGEETVVVTLSKMAVRLKALDEQVRVALAIPPPEDPYLYHVRLAPEGAQPADITYYDYVPSAVEAVIASDTTRATRVVLDLDKAFSERMTEIIRSLFPQTSVSREVKEQSSEELRLKAELNTALIESGPFATALRVRIRLTIVDTAGHAIDVLDSTGTGSARKAMYWSIATRWQSYSRQALEQAFAELVTLIRASQPLRLHLKELAELHALPAGLTTAVQFGEQAAMLPNGRLDAGEEASLLIQTSNKGPGPAYAVAVQATSDRSQVTVTGDGSVGDLAPGEKKEIVLRVRGNLDLPSQVAKLRIETTEKRGYGAQPVLLELATGELVPLRLEIVDVTLDDRSAGGAHGDGDGQPANGETLEAIVRVRNVGPGEAVGVAVSMASPKAAAEILEATAVIPRIAANRVEEARLLLRLPIAFPASELPLSFQAVEARGTQVASVNKDQAWKVRTKRPGVELGYRLYDGNSTESAGNRDGIVSNGERIEVTVTPTNRGELPARGLRIAIESADPKLVPRPAVLEIGDLPVQAEGAVQRFAFEVPRAYGTDRSAGDLRFTLSISQQSFPPRKEPLTLTFRSLRPQLSLETAAPPALARGTGGELALRLRNQGMLRAEEVIVEVASDTAGVDLLDERGVPVAKRKLALGALDPQGMAPEQRLRINVRRNAAIGPAPLRIAISQKDFPALARDTVLAVTDEPAAVIAAARSEESVPESPPPLAPAAPATISFLRNTQGEHLLAEAIVLRFEVQSPTDLAEVRLTQNERLLPIDAARRTTGEVGGLQAAQYEIPVQLEVGENRFEVVAVTRQGQRSARPLTLFRDPEVGRIWVVAIGVSKYQDTGIESLRYADADARAVHAYFRDTFGLPESQIFLRVNEQATLREVKSVLGTRLAAQANDPRDTVILYFAGHGMRERVTGSLDADGLGKYFLPHDADRNDLYSTALDMDEVTNILRRLTPERVVVLLDSCFSGAAGGRSPFDPKAGGERALITGEFLDRMAQVGKGRVVMTASGPDESAQESADFGHGVFTYYLLDGLRGAADLSGDGEIDVHEVYRYVSDKVARATQRRQNPKLKEPDLVGRILLGRGAVRSRGEPPS